MKSNNQQKKTFTGFQEINEQGLENIQGGTVIGDLAGKVAGHTDSQAFHDAQSTFPLTHLQTHGKFYQYLAAGATAGAITGFAAGVRP